MGKLRPFVRKDSYMPNKKWTPLVIGNGYTTTDGASGPAPEYETVTGNPVSFNAITPFPLRQLSVAFSPKQDLHGYNSPWPAGGSKNKLPSVLNGGVSSITHNGATLTVENGMFKITGTATGSGGRYNLRTANFDLPAGTYTMKQTLVSQANWPSVFVLKASDNTALVTDNGTFTIDADTTVYVGWNVVNTYDYSVTAKCQLESGSTATGWIPYSNICPISGWNSLTVYHSGADTSDPQTISISIGSTVYSGTVDVVTGVVTVTHKSETMTGGESWVSYGAGNGYAHSTSDMKSGNWYSDTNAVCSNFPKINNNSNLGVRIGVNDIYIYVINANTLDGVSSSATFKTWLSSNPMQVTYPLATPLTIQLAPQEVESLAGENNVWSDANGDLTVEYRSN